MAATRGPVITGFSSRQMLLAVYTALVAFLTYACVYAYRKPFTVATFEGIRFAGVSYQTLLIISQVIGYMLSKFYGIRFISGLSRQGRWRTSAVLVGSAWLSLLAFAWVPPPFGMICFLVNGFALGFMWGIVFSYVEGRRATDFIGSVMAVSFIFAGGFTRTVAKWVMLYWEVSEFWMPFVTGLVFILPLAILIWLLEQIPAPDNADVNERTERITMSRFDRQNLLKQFGGGLVAVTVAYLFLTVMRDVRDNYMANIWTELGFGSNASIFAETETNITLIVLFTVSMLVLIRKNYKAFRMAYFIILLGFGMAGVASIMFSGGWMAGDRWMLLTGLGLYLAYIPFNCIFFERMIATFRIAGNVGFLIYLADAFGYLGSVAVMLTKELVGLSLNWTTFYSRGVILFSLIGILGTLFSWKFFSSKHKNMKLANE